MEVLWNILGGTCQAPVERLFSNDVIGVDVISENSFRENLHAGPNKPA
jgi:hypothetical protein